MEFKIKECFPEFLCLEEKETMDTGTFMYFNCIRDENFHDLPNALDNGELSGASESISIRNLMPGICEYPQPCLSLAAQWP